jgi:ParB family transcriptional regulator, chromosome partitioning protein
MSTRRKLTDAIASRQELNFVFGSTETKQEIQETIASAPEQRIQLSSILCTFTFVPDRKPVRYYYDTDELQQWAINDIKPNGIRSPLWVRPHPTKPEKYELVAGFRRYKAAEILKLSTVPVIVFQWTDEVAFQAAIAENANRRDFNALEELDNMLRLLEIQLGFEQSDVVSLLYRMNNALKGTTNQNVLVSPESEAVKQTFDSFGKITWQSFVSSRLPLLKKPDDVLDAIRRGEIQYTKGILVASLKDPRQRQELLENAQKNFMSVAEIKRQVIQLNQSTAADAETHDQSNLSSQQFKDRLTVTLETADKNQSLWQDTLKTQKLEKLLRQIEAIIQKSTK